MRAPVAIALLTSIIATGCGGWIRLGKHEPPPGRFIVVHVEIEGNEAIGDDPLIEKLFTHADNFGSFDDKPLLNRSELEPDERRIESVYAAHGYFHARVLGHRVEPFDDVSVRVYFQVEEGEPTHVSSVSFEGAEQVLSAQRSDTAAIERLGEVRALLTSLAVMRAGDVWTEAAHEAAKATIRRALRDRGFVYAEVVGIVRVSRATHQAEVWFGIVAGPLTRVEKVSVQSSREDRVLRRVAIEPGDIVEASKLLETERNIAGLGFFLSVSARPDRVPLDTALGERPPTYEVLRSLTWDPEVEVTVVVQERKVHEFSLGVGASLGGTRSEAYVGGGYQNRDLFGGLRFLDATLRPAYVVVPSFFQPDDHGFGGAVGLAFKQPSLFEEYLALEVNSDYELDLKTSHRSHVVRGSVALSRPVLSGHLTPHIGYTIEFTQNFDITDPDEAATQSIDEVPVLLSYLEQGLALDWRDNVLDPRNGFFAQFVVRESFSGLGSDDNYVFVSADLRGYWQLWKRLTLALRMRWAQNFELFGDFTPEPARLKGGGSTDMRGFGSQLMGPASCDGGITTLEPFCPDGSSPGARGGGNLQLLGTFEARFYLPWDLGLVAFVDVGQVWASPSDVSSATLDVAVGPGLRYYTVLGPIRMDFGLLLTTPDAPAFVFHLTIGQAF